MTYKTYAKYALSAMLAFGASCVQEKPYTSDTCKTEHILPSQGNYHKTTCLLDADNDGFPEQRESTFYHGSKPVFSETRYFQWNLGISMLTKKVYSSAGEMQRMEIDFSNDGSPDEVFEYATLDGKVQKNRFLKNEKGELIAVAE